MQVIYEANEFAQYAAGCVATIGKFDGVHLGHQLILDQLQQKSDQFKCPTLVILIEPHPEEFFASDPSQCPARLTLLEEKIALLEGYGVDYVFVLEFSQELRELSAEDYIRNILVEGLGIESFIVGSDFRFGHQRQGDYQLLQDQGRELGFEVVETATYERNGQRISSTYVREKLVEGRFDLVELLLGRPFSISGEVVPGQQLGSDLGFPTCNIRLHRRKTPLHGVYACEVDINGRTHMAAVNIGYRPTVTEDGDALLEAHILDFSGDVYGKTLRVVFRHKIRDEEKFENLEELKRYIDADVRTVRELLAATSTNNDQQ